MDIINNLSYKKIISIILITLFLIILIFYMMNRQLKIGKMYYGFELLQKKHIEEINSNVYIFNHKKSGARLIYLENDDDNKVFSVNFRTPTHDNSGVNHILEHSVLCGSKKYPVKDPFLQLNKGSLNTFLNALTYYDKTMFPIASRNEKDYKNLMSVYLDAVFYPNIYTNENIFKQEGWRYDIDSVRGNLKYNGIVYNEMKGIYSSPLEILNSYNLKSLFPDTVYKNDSGGNPDEITNLTYEEFLNTHRKYYRPSNSYIYLYGNLNIKEQLNFIDEEYLSKFEDEKVDSEVHEQKPFDNMKILEKNYQVPKKSSKKDKSYISLNFVVDNIKNKEAIILFEILNNILIETPSSKIKNDLLNAGIGENIYSHFDVDLIQPVYSIIVENCESSKKDEFLNIVNRDLREIVAKGIDEKLVNSIMSSYEINMNTVKTDKNRGLNFNEAVMRTWLYDGDPTTYFSLEKSLEYIKKNYKNDRLFEMAIDKYLINNKHSSMVILNPVAEVEKMKSLKSALTDKELQNLVDLNLEFKKWQNTKDSKAEINSIPTLKIKDIDNKSENIITEKEMYKNITILNHDICANKLGFVNYYFDSSTVKQDKLMYMYLLSEILGEVNTKNYKLKELSQKIMENSGNISFEVGAFSKFKNDNVYFPKFIISTYTLNEKMEKNLDIINEIINNSDFTDYKKINEIIKEIKANLNSQISEDSLNIASSRLKSYFSPFEEYEDQSMLPYYSFICDLDDNFETKKGEISENLKEVSKQVFNKENLIVSFTGDKKGYKNFVDIFKNAQLDISDRVFDKNKYSFTKKENKEALIIPSKVQYVVKGYNFNKLGYEYNGNMRVLKNIIENDYLWQEIRVKGGAYGGFMSLSPNGNLEFMSYRDPNLSKTLKNYDGISSFIKGLNFNEDELTNHIIGAIGNVDVLKNPFEKGRLYDEYYIKGITQGDIQKERDEILNTKLMDIKNYSQMLDEMMKKNNYCVVGNESIIMQNKNIFNNIINLTDCLSN